MQGCAWRCEARRGEPRSGSAWHGLASAFLNVGVGVFGARYGELRTRQACRVAVRCGKAGYGEVRRGPVWQGATSKANRLGSGFDKRNVCVSMFSVVTTTTTNRSSPTRDFDRFEVSLL
jgi:hypothetical protein